ncbi:MAG: dTMP kinase [Endomicrobium sp.]|jgi:dTMP kinase|nr:dTMP kinase [Endomicrobium sp.]
MDRTRYFITIEGGDGSGKTTQSLLLKEYLKIKGYRVLVTREPGGTDLAENIRNILLNPTSKLVPLAELFLYEAARVQHVKEIILPALKSGKIVICDRFTDATIAYQGYGRSLSLSFINKLNLEASFGLVPNLTIYLDIVPLKGLNKAKTICEKQYHWKDGDRFEKESVQFHKRVRRGYLNQAKKYSTRIKIIKTQNDLEKTQKLIRKVVDMEL